MAKRPQYEAIPDGGTVSLIVAITQAVQAMDLAGEIATNSGDIDGLLRVSDKWVDFGGKLEELLDGHEDEEEDSEESIKTNFGFHGSAAIIEKPEVENAGAVDKGKYQTRYHFKIR